MEVPRPSSAAQPAQDELKSLRDVLEKIANQLSVQLPSGPGRYNGLVEHIALLSAELTSLKEENERLESENALLRTNVPDEDESEGEDGTAKQGDFEIKAEINRLNQGLTTVEVAGRTMARTFRHNKALKHLNLIDQQISDDVAEALAEGLRSKRNTLKVLNLGGNRIGDVGAKALGNALRTNTSLTYLELTRNNISTEGAKAIAQALHSNKSLNELGLGGNAIGDAGAAAFIEALNANETLKTFHRWGLGLTAPVEQALSKAMRGRA
eukprot:c33375_g1_i1.p1 GENE.c33375_g1_i1~~c33375_g1_i1.p1  ORF type:complete len:284 (-),score=89.70 c33375_g1_i1:5-808(-)